MSALPYSFSEAVCDRGWPSAWKEALRHLVDEKGLDSSAAVRLLCQEPVSVPHRTEGTITAALPAALALDVIRLHNDHKNMDALESITWDIKEAFRYNFTLRERYVYPASADEGKPLPGLGALWLVTWAHQPDKRFQGRRRHGKSHTNLTWPDQFFMDATGETYASRLKGQERLMNEAVAAQPVLWSNLDPKAPSDFRSEFLSVLHRVHINWAVALKRGEEEHEAGLYRLLHRTIQSGRMEDRGESPSHAARWAKYQHHVTSFVLGGIKEKLSVSEKLTRSIDAIVFYMGPTAIKAGNWIERTQKLVDAGGILSKDDACSEERVARLSRLYPALLSAMRQVSAHAQPDEVTAPLPTRPRFRA